MTARDDLLARLANDCEIAANSLEATGTFPTGQGILRESAARIRALEAELSELRRTYLAQMGPAADRYDAPEWIWASPDIDDGWRWPVLSKFPIQGPPIEKQVCFVRADLSSHLAQMGQEADRYDALVTAIRPVADMADISGVEFARKHPDLDAKLDKVEAENWGAVLADVVSDALAAWEKHNGK